MLARGATAAALRAQGWRLQTREGLIAAPANVAETPSALGAQDLVIVAVKGPSLGSVAAIVAPLLGPDTAVLTAMNGVPWWFFQGFGTTYRDMALRSVDPDGRIAAALPARRIVGCVVHASCSTPEPGLVQHHGASGCSSASHPAIRRRASRRLPRNFRARVSMSTSRPASSATSGTSCGAT